MAGVEKEILIFLAAFLTGVFLKIVYRCLECLRKIWRHSFLAIGIEDFIYWIFVEMYLFVQIYHTSSGSLRWYYVLGVVCGAFLMTWIFRKIEKMCKKFYTRKT